MQFFQLVIYIEYNYVVHHFVAEYACADDDLRSSKYWLLNQRIHAIDNHMWLN